jgi:3-(3-hydroxy-phenyl)propionate hydroxylase/flavoprotein hydroxylase
MTQQCDYDIIQIGYGPVSKVAALLFAKQGWKVGIFERFQEVYPLPRAVCIDHEIYRMLAAIGLEDLTRKVTEPSPIYRWFNAEWKELLAIDWTGSSVSGTEGVKFVHQPSFERALDAEVKRTPGIDLHMRAEAVDRKSVV